MGAIMLAYGVLAALFARERTGVGQEVDASHLGSMMALQGLNVVARTIMGKEFPRNTRANAYNPLWNHYRCADDKWISLAMLQPDRYWKDFCEVVGKPELIADPRFAEIKIRGKNVGRSWLRYSTRCSRRARATNGCECSRVAATLSTRL